MLTILHLDMLSTKGDLYTAVYQHYTILPDIHTTQAQGGAENIPMFYVWKD